MIKRHDKLNENIYYELIDLEVVFHIDLFNILVLAFD